MQAITYLAHTFLSSCSLQMPWGVDSEASSPVGVLPVGVSPVGVSPVGVSPVGVIPVGVSPVGVSPVGVIPVGVIPEGVIPAGVIPVGVILGVAYSGSIVGLTVSSTSDCSSAGTEFISFDTRSIKSFVTLA